MQGFLKFHALNTDSRRVSDIPALILAIISADAGATRTISAHSDKSMCNTGSPILDHILHSSSSVKTNVSPPHASNCSQTKGLYCFAALKKCREALLHTTRTTKCLFFNSSMTISGTFKVATEPEEHIRIRVTPSIAFHIKCVSRC